MLRSLLILAAVLSLFAQCTYGTPYWIDWEGTDWPENQGWTRDWGDWQGQHHGSGAQRTLEDGGLNYDSLYDPGVYDYCFMERPGQMNPGSGETFELQWRLKIDVVNGAGDPGLSISSDDNWAIGYTYAGDHLRSIFENYLSIPFAPGIWHDYRIVSTSMRDYQLYIDDTLAHNGAFAYVGFGGSHVGWGDCAQGASSIHHWDHFQFGTITPEPACVWLLLAMTAWCVAERR